MWLQLLLAVIVWAPELSGRAQPAGGFRDVLKYGAKPDGKTLCTAAINQAIGECSAAGGGSVVFPAGRYLCGSLELSNNVTLLLEAGAVIAASANAADYGSQRTTVIGEVAGEGLLTARHASNIAITGRGVIEGNGMFFVDPVRLKLVEGKDYEKKYIRQGEDYLNPKYGSADGPLDPSDNRPGNLIRFIDCTNVLLSGVTIQNSPIWTVLVANSERVNIDGISINSFGSGRRVPNDDGIDLVQSRLVHISGCDIQNGDDCIAVLGSEKITVDNCTLSSRSTAVRVGFAGRDIRDCVFANLVIHDSNRGLGVYVRGAGSVENVLFSDIVIRTRLMTGHWWGKAEPIHISAIVRDTNTVQIGEIKNIRFRNIIAEGEDGIIVCGSPQSRIKDVVFDGVKIRMKNGPLQESYGGNFDLRSSLDLSHALFAHDIPAFYGRFVDGLDLRGFKVEWAADAPKFFSHAIELEDFRRVRIDAFDGCAAPNAPGAAAISLARGGVISIRDCRAAEGTGTFLRTLEGVEGGLFVNNDLRAAKKASEPAQINFQSSANLPPAAGP
ncbi:MAG TPA: glycosyl hydrolase family 28 protein [Verrucomicrobiae bacterium]|jgi:hypothetical protein